jgi:hypothetical protein
MCDLIEIGYNGLKHSRGSNKEQINKNYELFIAKIIN